MPDRSDGGAPQPPGVHQVQVDIGLQWISDELERLGLTLSAIGSLSTTGDPRTSNMGAVRSEEVGALFEHFGRSVLSLRRQLDPLIIHVRREARPRENGAGPLPPPDTSLPAAPQAPCERI